MSELDDRIREEKKRLAMGVIQQLARADQRFVDGINEAIRLGEMSAESYRRRRRREALLFWCCVGVLVVLAVLASTR